MCDTVCWFAVHQPPRLETIENLMKLSQSCVTLCVLVCSAPAPSPGDDREPDEAESDDHTGHGGEGQSTAAAATHPAGHASSLHHSQGELAD